MITHNSLYGGVEAGGTKFICGLSSSPPNLSSKIQFGTTTPQETLEKVCEYFFPFVKEGRIRSIGVAAFGPVDTDLHSSTYGYITATPKPNWQNIDILGFLKREFGIPIAFHHDVSVSAIGEHKWGAAKGVDPSLYLTIGTGIGGGYLIDGIPLTGLSALEMGHIKIPHDFQKDPFEGNCPYHGDCFEGLAAGPAIFSRMGRRGEKISDNEPYWLLEAEYIANALVNYVLTLSPRIIILGGGVMHRPFLYDIVRKRVCEILNGYLKFDILTKNIDKYIVPPSLGKYSGVLGAIAMAMDLDRILK